MKKELQEKLYQKFPKLFREKDKTVRESCMVWGICCGDGWYNIIDALCTELTEYCKETGLDVVATQVKEKLSGLSFYVGGVDGQAQKIVSKHASMSYKTCEHCGNEGDRKSDRRWIYTMCDTCWDKWKTGWRPWGDNGE